MLLNKDVEFRAWDENESRMIYSGTEQNDYPFSWMIHSDGIDIVEHDGTDWNYLKELEFMQYVRVKDKNKKKIFEGDIVHCWGGEYWQGYWEHNDTIVVDCIDNPFTMMELTESENIEVIGDIYNNIDLLQRCKNKIV